MSITTARDSEEVLQGTLAKPEGSETDSSVHTGADSPHRENISEENEVGSGNEADGVNKCTHEGCGKTFKSKYSLKRHMLSHLDVKKYQCQYCSKRFVLKQYLKEHTYIHTGEKPYKCPFEGCGKSFRQACKLSLHKKNHKLELYQKEIEEKLEALAALKKTQSEQLEKSKSQVMPTLPVGFQLAHNMVIQTLPNGQQIQYVATNAPGFVHNTPTTTTPSHDQQSLQHQGTPQQGNVFPGQYNVNAGNMAILQQQQQQLQLGNGTGPGLAMIGQQNQGMTMMVNGAQESVTVPGSYMGSYATSAGTTAAPINHYQPQYQFQGITTMPNLGQQQHQQQQQVQQNQVTMLPTFPRPQRKKKSKARKGKCQ